MEEQMKITDDRGREIILPKELEKIEKEAREMQKAINKASALITDAQNRYIKEKTRARSKKAAEERDAVLQSARFKALEQIDRREDIQEMYGWDFISEEERDRLEELWDEREEIRNHIENGIYSDLVTRALGEAWGYIQDLWLDERTKAEGMRRDFDIQMKQAEEEYRKRKDAEDEFFRKFTQGGNRNED